VNKSNWPRPEKSAYARTTPTPERPPGSCCGVKPTVLKFWYEVGKTALATATSGCGEWIAPSVAPVPPPQADSHTTNKSTPQRSMTGLHLKRFAHQTTNPGDLMKSVGIYNNIIKNQINIHLINTNDAGHRTA
jgi:hypothetical protein